MVLAFKLQNHRIKHAERKQEMRKDNKRNEVREIDSKIIQAYPFSLTCVM